MYISCYIQNYKGHITEKVRFTCIPLVISCAMCNKHCVQTLQHPVETNIFGVTSLFRRWLAECSWLMPGEVGSQGDFCCYFKMLTDKHTHTHTHTHTNIWKHALHWSVPWPTLKTVTALSSEKSGCMNYFVAAGLKTQTCEPQATYCMVQSVIFLAEVSSIVRLPVICS